MMNRTFELLKLLFFVSCIHVVIYTHNFYQLIIYSSFLIHPYLHCLNQHNLHVAPCLVGSRKHIFVEK